MQLRDSEHFPSFNHFKLRSVSTSLHSHFTTHKTVIEMASPQAATTTTPAAIAIDDSLLQRIRSFRKNSVFGVSNEHNITEE